MAGAAGGADLPDDGEDQVLRRHTERQGAVDGNPHILERALDQRLGRQHMLDLRRADAEGERAEGAVGRRMAVAAHDGRARQGEALLRADDMDDALADVVHVEEFDAEFLGVRAQQVDLDLRFLVVDRHAPARRGRDVVVRHCERQLGPAHRPAVLAQSFEGLGAGDLVHQVPVDIDQACAVVLFMHQVALPDLVEERSGLGHRLASLSGFRAAVRGIAAVARRGTAPDSFSLPSLPCRRRRQTPFRLPPRSTRPPLRQRRIPPMSFRLPL